MAVSNVLLGLMAHSDVRGNVYVRNLSLRLPSIKLLSLRFNFHLQSRDTVKKRFVLPPLTSKLCRLLFGLIVRVVTWVELRGYPAPDVPLTSAWVSSWVHQGVVATGKTSPTLKAHPIHHHIFSLPLSSPPIPISLHLFFISGLRPSLFLANWEGCPPYWPYRNLLPLNL